ncbi:hypothetical protein BGZ79_004549 [Entomortierella chlamydospora]|nr:hypothetical protein BGZ79_004549 [Entomortierella chlamydospora]
MHTPGEATAHALNLYEIRAHIAQFLSFSDITKAIRVCRQWNDFFHPLLFNAFKIAGNRKNPPLEVLQKYARYIHKLEFDALSAQAPPEYFFLQGCSSLTKLAFRIGNVPQYRVSDLLEENIKIPMELYDPDGDTEEDTEEDTEDSDDPDTGYGTFDNLIPIIATEQDLSQPLTPVGPPPRRVAMLHPWELARYFVSLHASSLREITLTCNTPSLAFWETLVRDCSMTLESLTLNTALIEKKAEVAFWKACRNLVSLDLVCQYPPFDGNRSSSSFRWSDENGADFFPRLKNIVIRNTHVHPLVELLKNSPNLESLGLTLSPKNIVPVLEALATVASPSSRFDLYPLASSLQTSTTFVHHTATTSIRKIWTSFQSMKILCWGGISDQQLSTFLRLTTSTVSLFAGGTGFGGEAMQAMRERSHFMTVREMKLDKCPNVTSKMVNTLLVSCPALELLSAERFYVVDMAQDGSQPWACLNMRELCLNIDLFDPYQEHIESADNDVLEGEGGESDKEANEAKEARKSMEALQVAERQKLIMAQLAKLKKLRILYASQGYLDFYHGRPKECVEFILEKGLDQLAGLTQLEEIYFDCRSYTPCLPEAEWMLKHWKRLKIVHRGVYMVYLDKAGHDLRTMFTAPEGFEIDQEAFDVLFDVFL